MYLEYCLYAMPVVLVTGAGAWLWLKLTGRNSRSDSRILVLGTVVAIIAVLFIPVIAKLLYGQASLSMAVSVISAFIICSAIIGLGFLLIRVVTALAGAKSKASPAMPVTPSYIAEASGEAALASVENGVDTGIFTEKNVDTGRNTDRIGVDENQTSEEKIRKLLEISLGLKMSGRLVEAADSYRELLSMTDDKDFATQIIIEICGILKRINSTRIIHEILDSEQGNLLDDDIKAGILNNIKPI